MGGFERFGEYLYKKYRFFNGMSYVMIQAFLGSFVSWGKNKVAVRQGII